MNVTLWAIWCHLFNLKDVKNTHRGVSTKSDTGDGWSSCLEIILMVPNRAKHHKYDEY